MKSICVLYLLVLVLSADAGTTATNLAMNSGFEENPGGAGNPPGWIFFTTAAPSVQISGGLVRSGSGCLEARAQGAVKVYSGAFQTLPIIPGALYTFSVFIRKSPSDPLSGGAEGRILIEWQTKEGIEVGRIEGEAWTRTLSSTRWREVTIRDARAPVDAERANFCIHMSEGDAAGGGSYLLDDVTITCREGE